jgi:uncharacterized membrane protein
MAQNATDHQRLHEQRPAEYRPHFKSTKIIVSLMASVISVGFAFWPGHFWELPDPTQTSTRIRAAVLVLWAIGAPLFFMIEYHFFDDRDDKAFARFKYGQSLAAKLWAGMSVALTVLYFGKGIVERLPK